MEQNRRSKRSGKITPQFLRQITVQDCLAENRPASKASSICYVDRGATPWMHTFFPHRFGASVDGFDFDGDDAVGLEVARGF